MKTLTLVVLAVGLCLLPVRSESQARPALTPEDVKQINELTEAFGKGILAKEWKTVSALYADNAVLYPPGETAVKGRTSIEACLAGLPGMTGFTVRTTSVEGRDDLAYAQGTYTMTIGRRAKRSRSRRLDTSCRSAASNQTGAGSSSVHMLNAH